MQPTMVWALPEFIEAVFDFEELSIVPLVVEPAVCLCLDLSFWALVLSDCVVVVVVVVVVVWPDVVGVVVVDVCAMALAAKASVATAQRMFFFMGLS